MVGLMLYSRHDVRADGFLPSDLNQDGIVNQRDVEVIKGSYSNSAGGIIATSPYDLNEDHNINALDLAIVEDNVGNGTDPDRDFDADGYTVADGDCKDRDVAINPFAEEKADGVDNNCTGTIDELVSYTPLASSEVYDIRVHFDTNTNPPAVSVTSVGTRTLDKAYSAAALGDYAAEVRDSQGNFLDAAFFGSCVGYDTPNDVDPSPNPSKTCDTNVLVPKTASGTTITIRSLRDAHFSLPVAITSAQKENSAVRAAGDWPACHSDFSRYTSECFEAESANPDVVDEVLDSLDRVSKTIPYLTKVKINRLSFSAGATICNQGVACFSPANGIAFSTDALQGRDHRIIEATVAHEFSHYLWYLFTTYGETGPGTDPSDLMRRQYSEMARFVNTKMCNNDTRKCVLDPTNLVHDWLRTVQPRICNGLDDACGTKLLLDWVDALNPATNKTDPSGPRPQEDIGTLRAYGQNKQEEHWAVMFEGIYLDTINALKVNTGTSDPTEYFSSIKSVIKSSPLYPNMNGLTSDLSFLGKNGLIKDWDHDGVDDKYDNCAPQTYPTLCTFDTGPDGENKCYNPDQSDTNHNTLGDKCEFGEGSWTACLPDGGLCPSPDGTNFSSNSPAVPRWPLNGDPHSPLDYCSTAPAVFVPNDGVYTSAGDICPSPDKN